MTRQDYFKGQIRQERENIAQGQSDKENLISRLRIERWEALLYETHGEDTHGFAEGILKAIELINE